MSDAPPLPSPPPSAGRFSRLFVYLHTGWRGRALIAGFLLLTLVAIGLLVRANWDSFRNYDWVFRPQWFLLALLSFALTLLLSAFAWHILMSRLAGFTRRRYNLKFWAYGNLAKRLPTPVWYIASRAVLYEPYGVSKTATSLVSGLELGLILISGLALFLLTLPFWALPATLTGDIAHSWLLAPLALGCLLLLHPCILSAVWRRLSPTAGAVQLQGKDALAWIAGYAVIWCTGAWGLFCTVSIFHPLPVSTWPAMLGMWTLANTVSLAGSLTLANIGLREISLTLLLTSLTSAPTALLAAVAVRLIWLTGEFVGGLASLWLK
jgi:hypothetical protein